jgi:Icc-related predicted phosphoesterase
MKIACISDVHFPVFKETFLKALEKIGKRECVDAVLLAGDVVNRNLLRYYPAVVKYLKRKIECEKIIACPGNNEFTPEKIVDICPDVTMLIDDVERVGKYYVYGSVGVLDKPTYWQEKNVRNIREIYRERLERIGKFLERYGERAILLTHYAPTYKTLLGESPSAYPSLGSKRLERLVEKFNPAICIHGHSHHGSKFAVVGKSKVVNVALPLWKEVVFLTLP